MAQPKSTSGWSVKTAAYYIAQPYAVKDTAVMGWYSNIPSVEVKSLAVDSLSVAVQSIS